MSAVYLVRHGQASFGAADYDVLSERGQQQAQVLGQALARAQAGFAVVASGDLQRHRQTAQACLEAMGLAPAWRSDAGWNEFDHVRVITALRPGRSSCPGITLIFIWGSIVMVNEIGPSPVVPSLNPNAAATPSSSLICVALSAIRRASDSRAFITACAITSRFSPRCGSSTSTRRSALSESASSSNERSAKSWLMITSFGGSRSS